MTEDEVRIVVGIMNEADGGCPDCAASLAKKLAKQYPEHSRVISEVWQAEYGLELFPVDEQKQPISDETLRYGWQPI